jgi:hypothetical protein
VTSEPHKEDCNCITCANKPPKGVLFVDGTLTKYFIEHDAKNILVELRSVIEAMDVFDLDHRLGKDDVTKFLKPMAEKRGVKIGHIAQPLRIALTGSENSPPMHDVMNILGKERVLGRIDRAILLFEDIVVWVAEVPKGDGTTKTIVKVDPPASLENPPKEGS